MLRVSPAIALLMALIMIYSWNKTDEAHVGLEKRRAEIQQAEKDVKSLKLESWNTFDRPVSFLETDRAWALEKREDLLNEIQAMQAHLPYSSQPDATMIGINGKKRHVSFLEEEINEIDANLVIARQNQAEGVSLLMAEAAKIQEDEGLLSRYKDPEVNKYEGRREFWVGICLLMFLSLCSFCPAFRYFVYFVTGTALLHHVTRKD